MIVLLGCLNDRLSLNPANVEVGRRLNELIPNHLELLCIKSKAILLTHCLVGRFSSSWMILINGLLLLQLDPRRLQLRDHILTGDVWAPRELGIEGCLRKNACLGGISLILIAQRALFLTNMQSSTLVTVLPTHYVLREVRQRVPLVRRPRGGGRPILAVFLFVQECDLILQYQVFDIGLHLTLALLVEEANHVGDLRHINFGGLALIELRSTLTFEIDWLCLPLVRRGQLSDSLWRPENHRLVLRFRVLLRFLLQLLQGMCIDR